MTRATEIGRTAALVVSFAVSVARADIVFVNHAATGGNTGQSWANAFTSLQSALASADPGDQVWVAKGTYRPASAGGARDATFPLRAGVEIYGGFAGNETQLAQRNPLVNVTTLSGDLNGNDLPGFVNIADNSMHVLTADDGGSGALLDGFTVRGGNADFDGDMLLVTSTAPRIRGCEFTANNAGQNAPDLGGFGGAVYVKVLGPSVDAHISGCRFVSNRGTSGGALGVLNQQLGAPHVVAVEDCLFLDNAAPHQSGGAVFSASSPFNATTHQEIRFDGCRFEGNSAQYAGAIIEQNTLHFTLNRCEFVSNGVLVGGGAVWHLHTAQKDAFPAAVTDCLFLNNATGGLVLASTSAEIVGSTFLGNGLPGSSVGAVLVGPYVFGCARSLTVVGSLFSGNTAAAGAAVRSSCGQGVRIVNSTIAGNTGTSAAGGVFSQAALTVDNTVLWGNTGAGSQTQEGQIATAAGAPIFANHCVIMGLNGSLGGAGNTGGDPQFADPLGPDGIPGTLDDDLRIGGGSSAIDAANNLAVSGLLKTDLDGNPRFVDDPATPDTGIAGGAGGAAVVDMGAYEFQADSCYPDCTGDDALTVADFGCFQTRFVAQDPYADCNADGSLTVADFGCFQTRFVAGCP